MAIISSFAIPCFASSECEEEQSPSFSRSSSRVSLLETEAETPQSDSSPQSDAFYENGDSQEILVITQSTRQEAYNDQVPPFAQKTRASTTTVTLERMKLKWYVSIGYSGFSWYFEIDTNKAEQKNLRTEPFFDYSSFSEEVEWVLV